VFGAQGLGIKVLTVVNLPGGGQAADIFEELSYEKPYVHSWYADTSGAQLLH